MMNVPSLFFFAQLMERKVASKQYSAPPRIIAAKPTSDPLLRRSRINYDQVIRALRRDGWVIVRQRGSHIRLQKETVTEVLKLTVPAHRPIKRSTLSHIIKHARLPLEKFLELL